MKHLRGALFLACVLTTAAACGEHELGSSSLRAVVSTDLVISQVYGGGGNTGATYTNDYVELVNIGTTTLQMSNYSIQYASAAGNFSKTSSTLYYDLPAFSLAPGQYFLVELASGGTNGAALPTPDATGTINMSGTNGKVALTLQANKLDACGMANTPCNATDWVDFVGYGGTASQYEGTGAAPVMSNTTADFRAACQDTGDNSVDFTNSAPSPHNSASTFLSCVADGGADAAMDGGIILVDGGTDADLDAALDADLDGGAADADLDGGAPDAETTDGGTTDSGTTDSGTADAGSTDGGLPGFDGGTKDAGAKDSGAKDASTDGPGEGGGGGCSCEVHGASTTPAWMGLGWAVGLAALVQSRRRRRNGAA